MLSRFISFLSGRKASPLAPVITPSPDLSGAALEGAIAAAETIYSANKTAFDSLSEDSYATRLEYNTRLNYIHSFILTLKEAAKSELKVIDLSYDYTDYSDPQSEAEDAYDAHSCGLEFVPSVLRVNGEYEDALNCIEGVIFSLGEAGFEVLTEFRVHKFDPEDALEAMREQHPEFFEEDM